jgi:subtilisin family serine protease
MSHFHRSGSQRRRSRRAATRIGGYARLCLELLESRDLFNATLAPDVGQIAAVSPPNDPKYGSLYGLQKISAYQAWQTTTGSTKVAVGIIDSGIDYTHRDLYLNIWINPEEIPAAIRNAKSTIDKDGDGLITLWDLNNPANAGLVADTNGNGFIDGGDLLAQWADGIDQDPTPHGSYKDDIIGWNFVTNTNNPFDDNGHGTHVAGTIGAIGNNALGVTGVAWKTSLMALKWLDAAGGGNLANAAKAIYYAADNGARVSNNSWGYYLGTTSDVVAKAIGDVQALGHIVVAAAGNDGFNNDKSKWRLYPASFSYANIIAVAATDSKDARPRWSNYGATTVDLGAPGVSILSTVPIAKDTDGVKDGYMLGSGTSMATPHVVGTIALMLSANPNLTASQIKSILLASVDPVNSMAGRTVSGGRLNAAKALQQTLSAAASSTSTTSTSDVTADSPGRKQPRAIRTAAEGDQSIESSLSFALGDQGWAIAESGSPSVPVDRHEVRDEYEAAAPLPPPAEDTPALRSRVVARDRLFALLGDFPSAWAEALGTSSRCAWL